MNVEEALFRAIEADPSDDVPWLALADRLEETGQPQRAELLRLQRELRGLPEGPEALEREERVQKMLARGVVPCVPTVTNSVGMRLALVPPGHFWVGSPESEEGRYGDEWPRKLVGVPRAFYLGVYPVTQGEYERVTGRNPSAHAATGRLRDKVAGVDTSRFPVEEVTWAQADAFCQALSGRREEKEAGRAYRLPTELEWEYACRGGASLYAPFPFGKRITAKQANYRDRDRRRKYPGRTTEVGSYPPNGFGLYDMPGNTWEWCADWYDSDAYARLKGEATMGPAEGERRNARGGTYNLERRRVRSADRSSFDPEYHDSDCGLRVLCEWRAPGEAGGPEGRPAGRKGRRRS
jgi:uncharacterized protein (TIGR02996 family)